MLVRVALVLVALVLAGWLALSLRGVRLEAKARSVLPHPPAPLTASSVDHADRILRDAERHNPDIRPFAGRALLYEAAGRPAAAAAILREVLRREPDNVRAAGVLYRVLSRSDPTAAPAARAYIFKIAPPVAGG